MDARKLYFIAFKLKMHENGHEDETGCTRCCTFGENWARDDGAEPLWKGVMIGN